MPPPAHIYTRKEAAKILGVSPQSPLEEVKAAYKAAALLKHPDKNPDDREKATEDFQKLGRAYEVLQEPPRALPKSNRGNFPGFSRKCECPDCVEANYREFLAKGYTGKGVPREFYERREREKEMASDWEEQVDQVFGDDDEDDERGARGGSVRAERARRAQREAEERRKRDAAAAGRGKAPRGSTTSNNNNNNNNNNISNVGDAAQASARPPQPDPEDEETHRAGGGKSKDRARVKITSPLRHEGGGIKYSPPEGSFGEGGKGGEGRGGAVVDEGAARKEATNWFEMPQVIFVNQQQQQPQLQPQPQPQQQRKQQTSTASNQSTESMQGQNGSGSPAPSSRNSSANAQAEKASLSPGHQKPSVKFASSPPGGGMPAGAVPCRRAAKCTNPSCGFWHPGAPTATPAAPAHSIATASSTAPSTASSTAASTASAASNRDSTPPAAATPAAGADANHGITPPLAHVTAKLDGASRDEGGKRGGAGGEGTDGAHASQEGEGGLIEEGGRGEEGLDSGPLADGCDAVRASIVPGMPLGAEEQDADQLISLFLPHLRVQGE